VKNLGKGMALRAAGSRKIDTKMFLGKSRLQGKKEKERKCK
jgi:hypothetical protein